jgi:hypothetical protein
MHPLLSIIESQTFADLAGFDSDGRIFGRLIIRGTPKDFDPDGAFLEQVGLAA